MPLSLIHLLAARACHADTLKRALDNTDNEESNSARRLLARLGIGPTHLADMRRGSAERLAKAKGGAARKTMGRVMCPSVVASVQDGCVVAVLRGPNHRADGQAKGGAAAQASVQDLRAQAAFEHQLAEADEHVRVLEAKLRAACAVLDVPVTTDLAAVARALLLAHTDLTERMEQVRQLLSVHDNDDVPDAIRALQGTLERVRGEVQGVCEVNRRLRARAESAEAASEHGPIADLLALGGERVEVSQEDGKYHAQVRLSEAAANDGDDWLCASGVTVREALLNLREKVKATLPTKPPEPIVLGPWRTLVQGGAMSFRSIMGGTIDGVRVGADGWAVFDRAGFCVCHGEETGEEGKVAADKWARANGYVLIDAEPGSLEGGLIRWDSRERVSIGVTTDGRTTIFVYKHDHGWRIRANGAPIETPIAHGPQTGDEGKRCALAAAHALGLTGGGE